jgi:hypothetical protein
VGKQSNRKLVAYLPLVFVATFLVVGVPMLLVFYLRTSGVVTSAWAGTTIGVAVSLLASYTGGAFWKTRTDSRDILFSDLMLWGWVQRWRSERRLTAAADLLGLTTGRPQAISGGRLTGDQKAGLLTQLTSGLEARDPYTHGHSRRVARHASNIAKRMGLSREEVAKIRAAGAMHDVGKVDTPTAVLHKEGKLTDEEYSIIKRHPVDGAAMVSTLRDDELTAMVRHHHERLDGKGYPDGLAGEAIPIGARILAVADTFDAITSTRPYRHAHAHKKALDILAADSGTQLDPDAVRAFCACYSGRRPLAYWTILANARPRLESLVGTGLAPAKAATMTNVMATAATAAAVGSAILGPVADAGVAPTSSRASSGPEARAAHAPTQMASKPTRPSHPGSRPGKDSLKAKASRSRDPRGGQSQANSRTQSNFRPQSSFRPQSRVQPQDNASSQNSVRPPISVQPQPIAPPSDNPRHRSQGHGKGKNHDKGHGRQKAHRQRKDQVKGKGRGQEVKFIPESPPGHANGQAPDGRPSPDAGGSPEQFRWPLTGDKKRWLKKPHGR